MPSEDPQVMHPRSRQLAQLLGSGVCLLAAGTLGAVLDGALGPVGFDRFADRLVGPPSPSPLSPLTVSRLAQLADRGPIALALLVVALVAVAVHRRPQPALAVALAGALTQALVILGKWLVDRRLLTSGASVPPVFVPSGPTYPSGHVSGATVVLVLAVLAVAPAGRRAQVAVGGLVLVLPIGTSLGALWTNSHVMTDVIGGVLVGAGAALAVWATVVPPARSGRIMRSGRSSVADRSAREEPGSRTSALG